MNPRCAILATVLLLAACGETKVIDSSGNVHVLRHEKGDVSSPALVESSLEDTANSLCPSGKWDVIESSTDMTQGSYGAVTRKITCK